MRSTEKRPFLSTCSNYYGRWKAILEDAIGVAETDHGQTVQQGSGVDVGMVSFLGSSLVRPRT